MAASDCNNGIIEIHNLLERNKYDRLLVHNASSESDTSEDVDTPLSKITLLYYRRDGIRCPQLAKTKASGMP